MCKTCFAAICLFIFISCNNTTDEKKVAIVTDATQKDSLVIIDTTASTYNNEYEVPDDACFASIFKGADKKLTNKKSVVKNGVETTVRELIGKEYAGKAYCSSGNEDLDGDGGKELWIRGYTGGTHCCDGWQVFVQQHSGSYELEDSLTAGHLCFDGRLFTFEFTEQLGYFMSCYACGFEDSASGFIPMREIKLKYENRKFQVLSYSAEEEKQLMKNLSILKRNSYKPQGIEGDYGYIKKEIAMNIAVYYFNHDKDWSKTRSLFDKYYIFKDAKSVIKELKEYIDYIDNRNSF